MKRTFAGIQRALGFLTAPTWLALYVLALCMGKAMTGGGMQVGVKVYGNSNCGVTVMGTITFKKLPGVVVHDERTV